MNHHIKPDLFDDKRVVTPITESWWLAMPGRGSRPVYLRFMSRAGLDYHVAARRRAIMTPPLYAIHVLPRG